jgi:hypothetical protein
MRGCDATRFRLSAHCTGEMQPAATRGRRPARRIVVSSLSYSEYRIFRRIGAGTGVWT